MLNIDDRLQPILKSKCKDPASSFWLLTKIALYMDENNKCWPSYKTLIEDTGYSETKVIRLLKQLKGAGVLSWTRRKKPNSKENKSNLYHVTKYIKLYMTLPTPVLVPPTNASVGTLPTPVLEEVLINEVLEEEEIKVKTKEQLHNEKLEASLLLVFKREMYENWDDSLKEAFRDFCYFRNRQMRFTWTEVTQLNGEARKVNISIEKYGMQETTKFIQRATLGGFMYIKYEPLRNNKPAPKEQTLTEYYNKYLKPNSFRHLRQNKPYIAQDYPKHKDSVLELKLELNCKNETLTTPFLYDVMYGMFTKAGAKPLSRYAVFRSFLNGLSDYKRNKGELRKLFTEYLKRR